MKLPECDIVGMYNWLDSIGRASRLFLKHIRLEFTDIFFLRYRDQCGKIWKKLISCHELSAKVSIELSSGGADYVGTYNFRGDITLVWTAYGLGV